MSSPWKYQKTRVMIWFNIITLTNNLWPEQYIPWKLFFSCFCHILATSGLALKYTSYFIPDFKEESWHSRLKNYFNNLFVTI